MRVTNSCEYKDIYPKDEKIMFCKKCGSPIQWNSNYDKLICTRCGRRHDPIEIRDRMWKAEESFIPREPIEGEDENGVLVLDVD
jgi:NADH pyrophosphatase NudC (nudix superfamily)